MLRSRPVARLLLLLCPVATAFAAPHGLEAPYREVSVALNGADCGPDVADETADAAHSHRGGRFREAVAGTLELNRNDVAGDAMQESSLDAADGAFTAIGHARGELAGDFDQIDYVEGAFLNAQSRSRVEFSFDLTQTGWLQLEATLTAQAAGAIDLSEARAAVVLRRVGSEAVLWETTTRGGPATFEGRVPLAPGRYRVTVTAETTLNDASFHPNSGRARASFAVRGLVRD